MERMTQYQILAFVLTFFSYAFLHTTRQGFANSQSEIQDFFCASCNSTAFCNQTLGHPCEDTNGICLFKDGCTMTITDDQCDSWDYESCKDKAESFLGSLDTMFLFAYAVGLFISGRLGDNFPMRAVLSIGMSLAGIIVTMFGVTRYLHFYNVYFYSFLMIMNGLVQSVGWPCVVAVMGNWFGKSSRGAVLGVWSACASAGNIFGKLIASATTDYGWEWTLIVAGSMLFTGGILVAMFLVPHPRDVGLLGPDVAGEGGDDQVSLVNNTEINSLVEKADESIPSKEPPAIGFIQALIIPGVIVYSLCYACIKLVNYSLMFWLTFYLKTGLGWGSQKADLISTLYDVGGIIGGAIGGYISDRMGVRGPVCFFMLLSSTGFLYLYREFGTTSTTNIVLMLLAGFWVGGPANLISSAIAADLGKKGELKDSSRSLSTVTGIVDGTGSVGAAAGQYLVTFIQTTVKKKSGKPASWDAVFYFLMAMCFASALCLVQTAYREIRGMGAKKKNYEVF